MNEIVGAGEELVLGKTLPAGLKNQSGDAAKDALVMSVWMGARKGENQTRVAVREVLVHSVHIPSPLPSTVQRSRYNPRRFHSKIFHRFITSHLLFLTFDIGLSTPAFQIPFSLDLLLV